MDIKNTVILVLIISCALLFYTFNQRNDAPQPPSSSIKNTQAQEQTTEETITPSVAQIKHPEKKDTQKESAKLVKQIKQDKKATTQKERIPVAEPVQEQAAEEEPIQATSEIEQPKQIHRTVKIKNAITPEMIKYRFWGTYYKPTDFYLTVGETTLKANDDIEHPINEHNQIEVTYHYEFKNGMVTGSKCVEFEIPQDQSAVSITFSWKKNHRLISSSGRAVGSKKGVLKSSCSFI